MFLIGLTGGIATGKSTVSGVLADLGCQIIDADKIAREVVEPGTQGWREIRLTFGDAVFYDDGQLNREKLGKLIFSDPDKRQKLNAITHPKIYKAMLWQLFRLFIKGHHFAVLDLPLLFETGKMAPYMTYTIVVRCETEQQLCRLMSRNNYSEEEAMMRINSQMPLEEKCKRATHIVDNSSDIEQTKILVTNIYKQFTNSYVHWKLRGILLGIVSILTYGGYYFIRKFF